MSMNARVNTTKSAIKRTGACEPRRFRVLEFRARKEEADRFRVDRLVLPRAVGGI
jgi:hypothetical protein